MKRPRPLIISTILCSLLLTLASPLTQLHASQQQTKETITAIPYNQALQMSQTRMISSRDISTQINNIQMLHRDLRDEISRLEAGTFNRDRIDILRNELTELNELLSVAMMQQFDAQNSIDISMQHLIGGLANVGEEDSNVFLGEALQSVTASMATMQGVSGDIAMMQIRQAAITEEIQRLQNITGLASILREARNSLNELERQIDRLHLHQEQAELAMEFVLRSIIADMTEQTLQISAMEAELALAEENQRRLALSYQLGFISRHDFNTSEHNFAQNQAQLESLIRSHHISRQNLNYLLGLPLSQPTVITFNRHLPQIPQNPAARIMETVSQSPTIKQLQIDVDSAMGARRAYTGNDRNINISENDRQRAIGSAANDNNNIAAIRNRIALQDAVERAELELAQTLRTMEASLHRAYTDFEGLVAQAATLRRELTQAQAVLDAATTSFELGRVARMEVDMAQLTILRVEQDLERVLNQKWVLGFTLENPGLLR